VIDFTNRSIFMDRPKQVAEEQLRIAMIDKLILAALADRPSGLEKSIAQWRSMDHGRSAQAESGEAL
jgi:hypothetical protein